jgi:ABC-2 type transport system ATP-binding protein
MAKRSRRPPAVIRTKRLTKRFGKILAVDDLDLEVHRGEVFGYLGPNGSGKTTTIRMLLDFIRPTAGEIDVLGGTGADPEVRRRIGYLPGELRFDERYTSAELFDFYAALRGGVDAAYLDSLIERFSLDPSRRFKELSSGNRRKVALVQAFMHQPELLILDEPTQGLDPLLQREFQELVAETAGDGTTVFLSSHVLHEVEHLAARVGILRRGKLITVAGVEELRGKARQHVDLYTPKKESPAAFKRIPEVVDARGDGRVIRLVVEGSMERVIKAAARLGVQKIISEEPDLEDVFLDLYGKGEP